ncbi:MAG: YkgJ family cysteine cluster protein [Planctomycetes bacterium]|nr:YkgJ family cysteine cluster protein [Planctomycetota bacterium]
MRSGTPPSAEKIFAEIDMSVGDRKLHLKLSVDPGPMRLVELLPLAQNLANTMVQAAVEDVVEKGEAISCKKGCGACCRQLVPISQVEARRIRDLVEEMPEPRRSQIRARFAEARRRLEEAGILEKLLDREHWAPDGIETIGLEYFRQGIPCPFLEDESCSIHPDRPITCREYLVTSPAENCARPTRESVNTARIPLKVWTAVARFDKLPPGERFIRWVPLILAPEWADANPDETPPRPGPELLKELFEHLTGKDIPAPPLGLA